MAEKFEAWGVFELFGHQRTAGRLTGENIAGSNLLRVDIPVNAHDFRTVYYGAGAIYALHITDEEAARKMAAQSSSKPAFAYIIETANPRLAAAGAFNSRDPDDEIPYDET